MSANEIHLNDIGTVFQVTVSDGTSAYDISGATTKQIIFKKPDHTLVTKDAEFVTDGTDGVIKYTTVDGDLNIPGKWALQAYLVTPGGTWKTDIGTFRVYDNLEV
jgi:hypothetical protein